MIQTLSRPGPYIAEFERLETRRGGRGGAWLMPLRRAAMARFAELGFPTTDQEHWRHTNLAPLAATPFGPADPDAHPGPEQLAPLLPAGQAARLVFVNGRFAPELSDTGSLPEGVLVRDLAPALEQPDAPLRAHLARHAAYRDQPLVALNSALFEDGALVHVARGVVVERPIHVVFVTTRQAAPVVTYPRTLIVAEAQSALSLVEAFAGLPPPGSQPPGAGAGAYFTNAVTELVAGENAHVDYCKVQRESAAAFHLHTLRISQQCNSTLAAHAVTLGGRLARTDLHATFDGPGAGAALEGLALLAGTQHADDHLRVEHLQPHCTSREFYKNVLSGQARAVFTGRICVARTAQKTDAKQTNMNLLLSDAARVDTRPQLEIFADDVKCTHGATIGQLDPDALFYLRSRGLPDGAARQLLIQAFAGEIIDRIPAEALRTQLRRELAARLPGGAAPGGAA